MDPAKEASMKKEHKAIMLINQTLIGATSGLMTCVLMYNHAHATSPEMSVLMSAVSAAEAIPIAGANAAALYGAYRLKPL
jgi:hypothetical protein